MTDPRLGELHAVIRRLPRRSGIIFRHYDLPRAARRALFDTVRPVARAQGHSLLLADTPSVARAWGADGAHDRSARRSCGLRTAAVHTRREAVAAQRAGADLILVSPVLATRSHPGKPGIGRLGLARIAGRQRCRTIALGGMNARRAKQLSALGIYGWAAIDAFRI